MESSLTNFLYHYSYFAIFLLSFISSMGIPAGAEVAIIGGGALASGDVHKLMSNGQPSSEFFHLSLVLVILVALVGEVLGSMVGYLIGMKGGRLAVDKWGKYLLLTHKDLDRAWFDRHGEPLVLFGRFIPLLRSFVSFAAGLAEMAFAKFVVYTVIGCAVWCTGLSVLGYSLGGTYDQVQKSFSYASYVILVVVVVAVALLIWHRFRTMRGGADLTRRAPAGAKKAALQASEHLERSEQWNGLRAGDRVVVGGLSLRGATWEFRAYVVNTKNGTASVEVVGGRPGDRSIRSFGPERIFAVTGRRPRGSTKAIVGQLSLAEEPQLPLG